ncbi:hypothetical protein [Acinetobacter sp. WC-141]|uniref:hypothetical protein n=1 Tax=Acinetobacter sp. WC-141 TaxID=903915 RepID=UPI00029C8953|nr:hypothetical protein [Acinetobacter sp. WC-141]EKU37395.1 hypothetical protein ACINWC141_1073 [Acinetobacter sp. WC-141]
MQTNLSNQEQIIQSWFEPALYTLNQLIEKRKENLRRINRDENNAAVLRDELIESLSYQHGITFYFAGEVVASLGRAKKIRFLGRFIQAVEGGEA